MSQAAPTLVVVSHYDPRSAGDVDRLLASLGARPAGAAYDVAVVVNQDGGPALKLAPGVRVHERANAGMNIGAWDHGWRAEPGYRFYLFLQDECVAIRDNWLAAFLERGADPSIGLLGETLNAAWDKPWANIARARANESIRDHTLNGAPAPRVDVYLDFMKRHGIDPGPVARHLRSVVWFARREVLEAIDGFPVGANYGECIAAEIGVSRKIEAMGMRVEQVAREPFHYFAHPQYPPETFGGKLRRWAAR